MVMEEEDLVLDMGVLWKFFKKSFSLKKFQKTSR